MRNLLEQHFGAKAVEGYIAGQFQKIDTNDAGQVLDFIKRTPITALVSMPAEHRYFAYATMAKAAPSAKRVVYNRLQRAAFKMLYAAPYPVEIDAIENRHAEGAIKDMRKHLFDPRLDILSRIQSPEHYQYLFDLVTHTVLSQHGRADLKPITLEFDDGMNANVNEFNARTGVLKTNPKNANTLLINLVSNASYWQTYSLVLHDSANPDTQNSLFSAVQKESQLSYKTWLEHRGKLGNFGETLMMHNRIASQFSNKLTHYLTGNKTPLGTDAIGRTSGIISEPMQYVYVSRLSRELTANHLGITTTLKVVASNALNAVRASTYRVS